MLADDSKPSTRTAFSHQPACMSAHQKACRAARNSAEASAAPMMGRTLHAPLMGAWENTNVESTTSTSTSPLQEGRWAGSRAFIKRNFAAARTAFLSQDRRVRFKASQVLRPLNHCLTATDSCMVMLLVPTSPPAITGALVMVASTSSPFSCSQGNQGRAVSSRRRRISNQQKAKADVAVQGRRAGQGDRGSGMSLQSRSAGRGAGAIGSAAMLAVGHKDIEHGCYADCTDKSGGVIDSCRAPCGR